MMAKSRYLWTSHETETLIQLNEAGYADAEIGAAVGKSRKSVAEKRRRMALPTNHAAHWAADDVATAIEMRDAGFDVIRIAAKIGKSVPAVQHKLREPKKLQRQGPARSESPTEIYMARAGFKIGDRPYQDATPEDNVRIARAYRASGLTARDMARIKGPLLPVARRP